MLYCTSCCHEPWPKNNAKQKMQKTVFIDSNRAQKSKLAAWKVQDIFPCGRGYMSENWHHCIMVPKRIILTQWCQFSALYPLQQGKNILRLSGRCFKLSFFSHTVETYHFWYRYSLFWPNYVRDHIKSSTPLKKRQLNAFIPRQPPPS